jgi:hypothetical protein
MKRARAIEPTQQVAVRFIGSQGEPRMKIRLHGEAT